MPLYVPRTTGRAAFDELDAVPWNELSHAYGTGIGQAPYEDVPSSLRRLGDDDEDALDDGVDLLFSNVCHQGTIYEVSAFAFPFIAAWGAGVELDERTESAVLQLLACIAIASTYTAPHGSHSGAWGANVGVATRAAIQASAPHLRTMAQRSSQLRQLVDALIPTVEPQRLEALLDA